MSNELTHSDKAHYRQVQLQGDSITGWLMDYLRDQGNVGKLIKQSLIAQHELTPPA